MFIKKSESGYVEKLPGVFQKTLTFGENTLMVNVRISKGAIIPTHQHPHEQTGTILFGKLEFQIEENHFIAQKGDSWTIPGNIPHGALASEDTSVIEVFNPVREDYLA